MSYQVAYTTHFRSTDNTLYEIWIGIEGYQGRALEICLEGDEPCVIEWQETGKTDVVQSSTCTLRVSNESDRQMVMLMGAANALCQVNRNGKPYWIGHLDDAVYEEPYSFNRAYVTELTFSDFGILNRLHFELEGKQSVGDIVRDCLDSIGYGNGSPINLYTSLLEPKTQQPITLDMLYINADRFEPESDSWGAMTSKREVLEEILRPLGLRIMQKNGQIYIYDMEYLRDHDNFHNYPVWKGTDAYLKGSETFGWYEVAFEPDVEETLAEDGLDYDKCNWVETDRFFALGYTGDTAFTGFSTHLQLGFYIETGIDIRPVPHVGISNRARFFRTHPVFTDSSDIGVAWRIKCKKIYLDVPLPNGQTVHLTTDAVLADNHPAKSLAETETVLSLATGYLPLIPDPNEYQLRVSLDFLLSFRDNPLDDPPEEWVIQQDWYPGKEQVWKGGNYFAFMLPVKLEVLDENGNAVCHYRNANASDIEVSPGGITTYHMAEVAPLGIGNGGWAPGAATWADMMLAYYKDYKEDDTDRDPLVTEGWVGNRIALSKEMEINGTLYRVRDDGEYLPLPPVAGRLRLTIGSGVFPFPLRTDHLLSPCYYQMAWQLYRNPEITIVKANRRDDGINTDTVYERESLYRYADHLSETMQAGTWRKGIAPSARGLFFNAIGNVWEKFIKNGSLRTLEQHRLRCLEDQTFNAQPVLSGTAELDIQFCAKREGSTPGTFLVTALRQDLHQDLEHVTMARIAPVGGFVYEFAWSDPYCAEEEQPYTFGWSNPVCAKGPGPFRFGWSNGVCVKQYIYFLEWEEMQAVVTD